MENTKIQNQLLEMLLARLERISADSYWAHRASGVRGALLRVLEKLENGRPVSGSELKRLVDLGFRILENATMEKYK
ncbi:MAG: hypothetical protein IPO36_09560 [Anaerolineales bacterium]|uniref:hypothetical protein n=1 Tax=Candidatus Villigracilis affinis TaxID=3140682 RepID=UPI001E1959AA|nr:hypothetical protein [Anaerolineales bacterium]MBK9602073.1 hypothetical protein [Anaerolineales bacterium]MBL0347844.1 hypothetical protein [Anaerolineales bacterium]